MLKKIAFKLTLTLVYMVSLNCYTQDIEPRRWTNLPIGLNYAGAGYAFTTGDLFLDPVLDIEDVKMKVHSIITSYVRPFKIGNKAARVDVLIPYSFGKWEGLLSGEPASVNRNGFNDPRIRFSYNIIGAPASNAAEVREYAIENPVNTTIGVSVAVWIPIGQYFEDKLINLGTNRFTFRPQFGMVHNWGLWSYELTGSIFLFTNNNDFFNGQERKQKPLYALQTHLIKRFNNGIWGSVSIGYGSGGKSTINGDTKDDLRKNLLGSASFGFTITKTQSGKIYYLWTDTIGDVGYDANTIGFA